MTRAPLFSSTTDPEYTSTIPGRGRIDLGTSGDDAVFSVLSYSYPLKFLSPRCAHDRVGVAYLLNYGGGLVGGDEIDVDVYVRGGASLLLLTQGTTKIFKQRTNTSPDGKVHADALVTRQTMLVQVDEKSALFLLPDAATCFKDAIYDQRQIFSCKSGASAVILDSLTSGRMSRGEEWDFRRYCSLNELWVDGRRVARDTLLLEATAADERNLRQRLKPYGCYATLLLLGPQVQPCIDALAEEYMNISQMRIARPSDLLWSFSVVDPQSGATVVRIAGIETESVRRWIRQRLQNLDHVIGYDALDMAFPP
ncbi:UreD-domain-containing protein [Auriculariales sp. MPI-PUGE-AT-0066]|nr:UreD-domain-containing protein [Auriculariales sp. MPI-PUGE-AT-0066]